MPLPVGANGVTRNDAELAFGPNAGQFRADVAFVARTRINQVFVLGDGRIVHALPIASTGAESVSAWVVVEELPGAAVAPIGARLSDQRVSWFSTATSPSVSDTRSFSTLKWSDAWPGVDMLLHVVGDRTERVFRVEPGADWRRIALAYDGARFEPDAGGGLIARDRDVVLTLSVPVAFQDTPEGRVPVDVRYVVAADGARVSFEVGAYDEHLPLTIDPVLQATYFGFGGTSTSVQPLAVLHDRPKGTCPG